MPSPIAGLLVVALLVWSMPSGAVPAAAIDGFSPEPGAPLDFVPAELHAAGLLTDDDYSRFLRARANPAATDLDGMTLHQFGIAAIFRQMLWATEDRARMEAVAAKLEGSRTMAFAEDMERRLSARFQPAPLTQPFDGTFPEVRLDPEAIRQTGAGDAAEFGPWIDVSGPRQPHIGGERPGAGNDCHDNCAIMMGACMYGCIQLFELCLVLFWYAPAVCYFLLAYCLILCALESQACRQACDAAPSNPACQRCRDAQESCFGFCAALSAICTGVTRRPECDLLIACEYLCNLFAQNGDDCSDVCGGGVDGIELPVGGAATASRRSCPLDEVPWTLGGNAPPPWSPHASVTDAMLPGVPVA